MKLPPGLRLSVEDAPSRADRELLNDALLAFNRDHLPAPEVARIGLFVRDGEGGIMAGLYGFAYGRWFYIDSLWVAEPLRRGGIGRALVAEAEAWASGQHCHSAWVDTFSFQAPQFYAKLGYETFATLDYPPRHSRHFLRKSLPALPGRAALT